MVREHGVLLDVTTSCQQSQVILQSLLACLAILGTSAKVTSSNHCTGIIQPNVL